MDSFSIFWRGALEAAYRVFAAVLNLGTRLKANRAAVWLAGGLAGLAALSALAIVLLPQLLGLIAPRLDLHQDLYAANRPIAITFLDADGNIVGHRGAVVGQRLTLKQMPPYLPAAFIAMEDRSFWNNPGFDLKGLLRAAWLDLRAGHVVAGGSTITQQVAKIIFTDQQRTLSRKWHELLDTAALNKSLSKSQLLELYLNRIYLGSGAYGVDGAARVYFGKSARNLTLPEAAMLATLTRAPSAFSPRNNLKAAQLRTRTVLRAMVETGAITAAQAEQAARQPVQLVDRSIADNRNYYFDTAADEALSLASADGKQPDTDLVVRTAFEPKLQDAARRAVAHVLSRQGKKLRASQAAVVVMTPEGAVAALLGGREYDDSTFNRATQAHRQPGSAFKPFVYLAALEQGVTPWDQRTDEPIDVGGWSPENFNHEQFGTITVAQALAHSVNTITVGLEQEVGIGNVIAAARRCGITSPLAANASLALGTSEVTPLELTGAYAVFANGGYRVKPYFVSEIRDAAGHVLYNRPQPKPQRIIAEHVDRDLTTMLYDVVTEGTGRRAALSGHEAAGKTGTTQDSHDAWFEGFTTDYVAGVWVGNDDMAPMRNVVGGSLPADIWHAVMTVAEQGKPAQQLAMSAPPPPSDDNNALFFGSGESQSNAAEDGGANMPENTPSPSQPAHEHNFWDWLFGRDRANNDNHPQPEQNRAPPDGQPSAPQQPPHYRWRNEGAAPQKGASDSRSYGVDQNPSGPQ